MSTQRTKEVLQVWKLSHFTYNSHSLVKSLCVWGGGQAVVTPYENLPF